MDAATDLPGHGGFRRLALQQGIDGRPDIVLFRFVGVHVIIDRAPICQLAGLVQNEGMRCASGAVVDPPAVSGRKGKES